VYDTFCVCKFKADAGFCQRLHVNARVSTGREIGQNVVFALSTKALNFKAWPRQCLYALIADINPDSVSLPDNETQHEDE
jgi:hypothetical protein